jgi:hypothetical protein
MVTTRGVTNNQPLAVFDCVYRARAVLGYGSLRQARGSSAVYRI